MNDTQNKALISLGTDVDGAIYRFGGNESVYVSCLKVFIEDDSFEQFRKVFAAREWAAAITAVHTLKGAAGNMGFMPLMHAAQQTLDLLRAGQYDDADAAAEQLESEYQSITEGIEQFFLIP